MTIVNLPFGKTGCQLSIPDDRLGAVLRPCEMTASGGPCLASALENPLGCGPLSQIVSNASKVAIIIDDISRPTPTHLMLPPLLKMIHQAGVKDSQIRIVIALGTHRPMTPDEIRYKLGPQIQARYPVINISCEDDSQFKYLGTSSNGIPAWINSTVADADVRIGVGMISPHMDAGYSGGAKIILPGVSGQKTVEAFHIRQAMLFGNQLGIAQAPLRMDLEEFVGEKIGLDFIFNCVIDQDGHVAGAVAGDFIQAHRRGTQMALQIFGIPAKRRFPIVISNAFPADIDLWQSVKGIASGELITEDGGTLILMTRCPEGNNTHPAYAGYLGKGPDALVADLTSGRVPDKVACALAVPISRIMERIRVVIASPGLDDQAAAKMGVDLYPSVTDAMQEAFKTHPGGKVGVLTHGGICLPVLSSS